MRRYFDENDEAFYYPPAWYLWLLWWLALPALVAIDKTQCWIVSRNLWRRAKPGHPMDLSSMDAMLRQHFSPERGEALAKQRIIPPWTYLDKDPEDGTD